MARPRPTRVLTRFVHRRSTTKRLITHTIFLSPPCSITRRRLSILLRDVGRGKSCTSVTYVAKDRSSCCCSARTVDRGCTTVSLRIIRRSVYHTVTRTIHFRYRACPHPCGITVLVRTPCCFRRTRVRTTVTTVSITPRCTSVQRIRSSATILCLFDRQFVACNGTCNLYR